MSIRQHVYVIRHGDTRHMVKAPTALEAYHKLRLQQGEQFFVRSDQITIADAPGTHFVLF